jgi:hypothetical protein
LADVVADEPETPRKVYGFKDREFKRDNRPASASQAPMPTAQELAILAGPVVKTAKPAGVKASDPNDVHHALQRNRAVEKKIGGDEVEIKVIKSRRKRDYWLLLICGNLAIVAPIAILGANAMTLGAGLGGVIIYSIGLTWVMWQIMGKY